MFVPPNITTDSGFTAFVKFLYPLLDDNDMLQVQELYPAIDGISTTRYATDGLDNTTNAVNVSPFVTGHQQRANVKIFRVLPRPKLKSRPTNKQIELVC
jgi:hypothetical protein